VRYEDVGDRMARRSGCGQNRYWSRNCQGQRQASVQPLHHPGLAPPLGRAAMLLGDDKGKAEIGKNAWANTPLCSCHRRPGSRRGDPAAEHGCRRETTTLPVYSTYMYTESGVVTEGWLDCSLRGGVNTPADRQ
jgi:hypothetical protein